MPLSSPVISRTSENKHPLFQGEEVGFSWGKAKNKEDEVIGEQ